MKIKPEPTRESPKALLLKIRPHDLAIGAPSSPMLSNILMSDFDLSVAAALQGSQLRFTRYADDLTFSAPRIEFLKGVQTFVRKSLRILEFPKIKVNEAKTVIVSQKL